MNNCASLTAEQWMLWVNYYDIIPSQHLECWRLFVLASRILKQASQVMILDLQMHYCCVFVETSNYSREQVLLHQISTYMLTCLTCVRD